MEAILKLKNRRIDKHIKHFAKDGALVEVLRYLSKDWATIKTSNKTNQFIIDVPSDILDIQRCTIHDNEITHTITHCKKCGENDG